MDRSVDLGGKGPTPDGGAVGDDGTADDGGSEDIEFELYCSTREAGVGTVSFGPIADG